MLAHADLVKMTPAQRITARNNEIIMEKSNRWVERAAKRFIENFGYDPRPQVAKPGFSLKEAHRQLREKFKLSEAVSSSQLFALTSFLVTQDMTAAYQLVPTIYRSLAGISQTTTAEGSYFPLQRADIPVPVEEMEAAPESRLGGVLTRIRNYKFARTLVYSTELDQDDQTGQVRENAGELGGGMAYAEEQWWVVQLFAAYVAANVRGTGQNQIIPPMNIAGQAPANYGGPACTAGPVAQTALENLYTAGDYVTDIEGNFALVQINAGLFANADKITVKKIMQSFFNPSGAAAAGVLGGAFMKNVLEGEFETYFTRFIVRARAGLDATNRPWGLGEAGKIGKFQDRTPLEVKTESPEAGKSFDEDTVRVKAKRRFGAGVDKPEFFMVGN